jgi:hypothetical protein
MIDTTQARAPRSPNWQVVALTRPDPVRRADAGPRCARTPLLLCLRERQQSLVGAGRLPITGR